MLSAHQTTAWEQETLYTSGDAYFADLLKSLAGASASVELETYIFEKGILAQRVSKALMAAAQRGVRVRVIVDGWGSPDFVYSQWPQLKAAGVQVRFFRVFPWILRRLPGDPKSLIQRILLRIRRTNKGNHRKFCLIDGKELWIGSFNVSDVHLQEVFGEEAWKDVGVRVVGPDIKYAHRAFRRAFRGWTALNWPARSPKLLLLNDSFLHKRFARQEHLRRLKKAKTRVWLATPYFVPIGQVFRQLVRKARQGLDVRLIVPSKNDVWLMNWMSVPLLRDLTHEGVKVFVYEPTFAHQKVFICDDWICVGSTNINHRSFLHDLEMDVVITQEANQQRLLDNYRQDQALSHPFDTSDWARLPWWKRGLSLVFKLAKYWS